MKKIAFYDTKPYDEEFFTKANENFDFEIKFLESKLNEDTAQLAHGCEGVCAFVNDTIDAPTVDRLYDIGVKVIAMRCSGYNNIDFKRCFNKIHVLRVPAYSPYAVAEHAIGMILMLNRKLHKAYIRTRDFNFSLNGLLGFDLKGKTVGVVGTGKIGQVFANICAGFGMRTIGYDLYPAKESVIEYTDLDTIYKEADIISLHCPLTDETRHMINKNSIEKMKDGVMIINTSRGMLIDSDALLDGLKEKKIGAAGLDVYEEESDLFFEDYSDKIILDDVLSRLLSMPNVLVTSHQAFFTGEALSNIANTTLNNLKEFFNGGDLTNEICYNCIKKGKCEKKNGRCF